MDQLGTLGRAGTADRMPVPPEAGTTRYPAKLAINTLTRSSI